VRCRVVGAAEEDLAQVGAVAQDRQHCLWVERLSVLGAVAALAEPAADRVRPLQPLGVALEDLAHDRCLRRVGFKVAPVIVEAVPEGEGAARPLTAGRPNRRGVRARCRERVLPAGHPRRRAVRALRRAPSSPPLSSSSEGNSASRKQAQRRPPSSSTAPARADTRASVPLDVALAQRDAQGEDHVVVATRKSITR